MTPILRHAEQSIKTSFKILAFTVIVALFVAVIGALVYVLTLKVPKGAVTTNGYPCADIGASILEKGGSAVDAAIAALFCEGVAMPQSMGLGGGFLMTIYIKETGNITTLNAREVAPENASEDMFGDGSSSTTGGKAVAVPAELRGYWYAYRQYGGKVAWRDLIQPTIDLCKSGILVTKYLAKVFHDKYDILIRDPLLTEIFIDPATGRGYLEDQHVKRMRLAKTLEIIAEEGGDAIHNGSLTRSLVQDIKDAGGIITERDLNNYQPEWQPPITIKLPFGQTLYTSPLPGSGLILGFIMNILGGFLDLSQPTSVRNWQRIIESFKFGYGKRTELGDTNFIDIEELISNLTSPEYAADIRQRIYDNRTFDDPSYYGANTTFVEDHGTAHISILAPNGDAVSVTSTINLYFGAGFVSPTTGIILNDQMDDFSSPNLISNFSIPPSIANYIRPGKRPLSSMCPSIVLDDGGDVRLIVGAAGGTKITTSIALIMVKELWFNVPLENAVSEPRVHHQLFPMTVEFEDDYAKEVDFLDKIRKIGHNVTLSPASGFSSATAISKKGNSIKTAVDKRRPGQKVFIYG